MKRVYFFATPSDIKPVLARFEQDGPLAFVKNGLLTSPDPPTYLSSSEIPDPGLATSETGSTSFSYLVFPRRSPISVRAYVSTDPEIAGQTRWSISNGANPDSVAMTLAGLWGADILLPGNVNTLHDNKTALQLVRRFLSALKKEEFVKIQMWWLGRQALEMLRSGKRLTTTAVQSPPEYDLPLPNELK